MRLTALTLCLASSAFLAACDRRDMPDEGPTGIQGIDKFAVPGPEPVTVARVGACTLFVPPNDGTSRPGMGWGTFNGSSPETYTALLTRVASFGTLVTATNTLAASGVEISGCIDQLDQMRLDSNGRFAAAGHADGASGAINASALNPKVEVTIPVTLEGVFTAMSDGRDIKGSADGPALILCATDDVLIRCDLAGNGDSKFQEAVVPITRISVDGTTFLDVARDGGELFSALVTTAVEAALGGDADALAALRPGGANGARGLSRIATRNQAP